MYMTREQIAELTGSSRRLTQVDWFANNHWVFAIGADGRPRVSIDEHQRNMVGGKPAEKDLEPVQ